uniref:Uncharacterized protein n=1 Tax=Apteryx owenii TaxID=8824 RepID=A0A8B9PKW6_APTOW
YLTEEKKKTEEVGVGAEELQRQGAGWRAPHGVVGAADAEHGHGGLVHVAQRVVAGPIRFPAPAGGTWGGGGRPPRGAPRARHTHAGAEGLEPRHQLLHGLPEGFERRAGLVHGEGLAVPAVRGGRARGVPVLRALAGGGRRVRGARLLPDLRVFRLQLVDLEEEEKQGGEA